MYSLIASHTLIPSIHNPISKSWKSSDEDGTIPPLIWLRAPREGETIYPCLWPIWNLGTLSRCHIGCWHCAQRGLWETGRFGRPGMITFNLVALISSTPTTLHKFYKLHHTILSLIYLHFIYLLSMIIQNDAFFSRLWTRKIVFLVFYCCIYNFQGFLKHIWGPSHIYIFCVNYSFLAPIHYIYQICHTNINMVR